MLCTDLTAVIYLMKDSLKRVGAFVIRQDVHLGEGSFAITCMAYRSKDEKKTPLACKIIKKDNLKMVKIDRKYFMERVQQEFKSLQELQHPNIVRFEGVE